MNIPIRSSEITGETREERVDSLIALVAKKEKERERQQLDTAGLICPICGERSDTNSYILIDGIYKHLCAKCEAILNSKRPPPNRRHIQALVREVRGHSEQPWGTKEQMDI